MSLRRKSLRKKQPSANNDRSKMANDGSTNSTDEIDAKNFGLFWDIGNYRRTVKRLNDGAFTCDEVIRMVSERADIEAKYAKKLTAWEDKWRRQIENGPLYNTSKTASLGVLKEAQQRASVHMDCWAKLQNQVVESVKIWKAQNYRKNLMGGWKETKEIDDQFVKAQKPWSEAYIKVQKAKRNFHSASKTHEAAAQNLSAQNKDGNVPPEKIKKLEDAVARHAKNVERMRIKYDEKLLRIEPLNTTYDQEMTKVFEKCQFMEEKRLNFMQDMLVEYHKALNIHEDERLGEMFKDQLQEAYGADVKQDLTYWAESFGADMPRNWPKFEEFGDASSTTSLNTPRDDLDLEPSYATPVYNPPLPSYTNPVAEPILDNSNPFVNGPGDSADDDWDEPPPEPVDGDGIPVRCMYDYSAVEGDELTFRAGDILTKMSEEDEQGWCRGRVNGKEGLFPANYVEAL